MEHRQRPSWKRGWLGFQAVCPWYALLSVYLREPDGLLQCRMVEADFEGFDYLNETLEQSFKHIEASAVGAASEDNFKGLFDDIYGAGRQV